MSEYEKLKANERYAIRHNMESEDFILSKFVQDRDRIIYSKEFRRLNGKTQVFISGFDDNVRNRFTHTCEVSQIAYTLSALLGFNNTLSVAISLGHDVGHTPFGHVGERTLNFILNGCDVLNDSYKIEKDNFGFKHNWQSLRVVSDLEQYSRKFRGINLTDYTLWGILNHSSLGGKPCGNSSMESNSPSNEIEGIRKCNLRNKRIKCDNTNTHLSLSFYEQYNKLLREESWTFEGLIVNIADEIAQRNHDIEDSIKANIITKDEFVDKIKECFNNELRPYESLIDEIHKEKDKAFYLPLISKFIMDFLITNLIESSKNNLNFILTHFEIKSNEDFEKKKIPIKKYYKEKKDELKSIISYTPDFSNGEKKLQDFIWNRILNSHITQSMDGKASYMIRNIVKAYLANPMQLPDQTILHMYKNNIYKKEDWEEKYLKYKQNELIGHLRDNLKNDYFQNNTQLIKNSLIRSVCDFIAGMTDNYAIYQYELLYGTAEQFRNY